MPEQNKTVRVYEGDGDRLMAKSFEDSPERVLMLPDSLPKATPDASAKLRIMWGQHLLEDLLLGRYRSLVCAVNADDNSRGIISQLAKLLPTSQWDEKSITEYAARFSSAGGPVKVLKYDMDAVEVLAVLRPSTRKHLTIHDLATAFMIVSDMIRRNTRRLPSATVSFLDARANKLLDQENREPSFEAILRTMHSAGYTGDVFPAPSMWNVAPIGVYARYPFPSALDSLRHGGF